LDKPSKTFTPENFHPLKFHFIGFDCGHGQPAVSLDEGLDFFLSDLCEMERFVSGLLAAVRAFTYL
jgi:hypothetical protein